MSPPIVNALLYTVQTKHGPPVFTPPKCFSTDSLQNRRSAFTTSVNTSAVNGPNVEISRPIAMNLTELAQTNVSTHNGYRNENLWAFTSILHDTVRKKKST